MNLKDVYKGALSAGWRGPAASQPTGLQIMPDGKLFLRSCHMYF